MTAPAKDQSYIILARSFIGQKEISGPRYNPWIRSLWALDMWIWGNNGDDGSKPWCGAFCAHCFRSNNYSPPKKYWRALEWREWGDDAGGPAHGAVAVMVRDGGGHVTFVTGISPDGSHFLGLGGNQGNKVSEVWFPVSRVVAWRLPIGNIKRAPRVLAVGAMSESEA